MKKRISFLIASILVLAFVLSGCGGDPYKGSYQELSEEQAEEYYDRVMELEDVISGKSLKSVFTIVSKDDEVLDKTEMSGTTLSDFSDPDNMKVYENLTMKRTTEDGVYELSLKAYTDSKTGKSLLEIKASAPQKDDYSFKGQLNYTFDDLKNVINSVGAGDVLYALERAIGEWSEGNNAKIYVDGDKMKATYDYTDEWGTEKGEVYAVLSENGFRCKFSETEHYNYGETDTLEAEITLSGEKVSLPTSGYDTEMSLSEFQATISTYMGD